MSADADSGAGRWRSPAGISALAAAAAVLVGAAGILVQLTGGSDREAPAQVGGPLDGATATASAPASGPGEVEPGPSVEAAAETASTAGDGGFSGPDDSPASGLIPAACIGCTSEEQAARQDHLDTLTARLAAPTDSSCLDTTETFTDGELLARIGCSFAGGFDVDYALWPDAVSLAQFTENAEGQPNAVVQEWQLLGVDGPVTGKTVEYVFDGSARMYWTYDTTLISANAQLSGGDQDRLNDWWRTSGALLRQDG